MVSPAATLTRPFTIQLCGIRGFRLDMFSVGGGGAVTCSCCGVLSGALLVSQRAYRSCKKLRGSLFLIPSRHTVYVYSQVKVLLALFTSSSGSVAC